MNTVLVSQSFNWVSLFSGLGIFLLGMLVLEKSLAYGAQTGIRKWLFAHTKTPIAAISTGTIITAFLQSSSLVTLILMAMVGANILPLTNAVGAVLGANLGTTFTGWLVTVLGFKLELSKMAIPMLGVGGLIAVFFDTRPKLSTLGAMLSGLGLLLFGLSLMKTSVETLPQVIDFSKLVGLSPLLLLLAGATLSAIIQSSSASMMIVLALLHAGLIALPEAAAFIIGADLGTTSTSGIAALKALPTRRRLAAAHIIFNLITDALAFLIFLPLLPWLSSLWPTKDPLLQLVIFHSSFNLFGIALFYPFLTPFTKMIDSMFKVPEPLATRFIHAVPVTETELALIALTQEVEALQSDVLRFCWRAVDGKHHTIRYQKLKIREGHIIHYGTQINHPVSMLLLSVARDCIYGAKSLNDVVEDWSVDHAPGQSSDVSKMLLSWRSSFKRHLALIRFLSVQVKQGQPIELNAIDKELQKTYHSQIEALHQFATGKEVTEDKLSSLLNLNRELLNTLDSLKSTIATLVQVKQSTQTQTIPKAQAIPQA